MCYYCSFSEGKQTKIVPSPRKTAQNYNIFCKYPKKIVILHDFYWFFCEIIDFFMKKTGKNTEIWKFIGKNVLIALLIVIVVLTIVILSLKKYTDHGHEIEVPQVTGLYQQEAEFLLKETGLQLSVIDSTFSSRVPLGTIVEQNPPAESHVKSGRMVYVVLNASVKRQVVLPELHDVSYRQAENTLRQLGLEVDSIIYEPSEYRDLILDLRLEDRSLETGDMITEGSKITIVVGQGIGTEMIQVPDLSGLSLSSARSMLLVQHLTMGQVQYDVEPTEENHDDYIVFMQEPQAGTMLLEGSSVEVKLSTDKAKAVTTNNVENEEEFF